MPFPVATKGADRGWTTKDLSLWAGKMGRKPPITRRPLPREGPRAARTVRAELAYRANPPQGPPTKARLGLGRRQQPYEGRL